MTNTTKLALEAALKKELLTKSLDKITINELAEDCGISRMAFYYHFKDIYDLVEWVCVEDGTKALQGKKNYENWQEGFCQIFEAVQENKPFIMNVYRCVDLQTIDASALGINDESEWKYFQIADRSTDHINLTKPIYRVHIDHSDGWPYHVNGVEEDSLFEGIMYAG